MELKYAITLNNKNASISSNCTFMELKSTIDIKRMKKNEF